MTSSENQAIVQLSLLAAFVDGDKHERERSEIKRIAERLGGADGVHLPSLYQDVLSRKVSLDSVAAALSASDDDARHLAYEMAVCVCDADGVQSQPEQAFLAQARTVLGLDAQAAERFGRHAEDMASAPLVSPLAAGAGTPAGAAVGASSVPAAAAPGGVASAVDETALDRMILQAAIVNGALELLPETLSTLAIIALQMKLVYSIGKMHGQELDRSHIKDFLATAGVGLTSQYLEQAGRKLLGGLLGRVGGGLLRGTGNQALSSGMSFASTYALGHVANRYYAGGRTLSTQMLKDAYAGVAQEARSLHTKYLPQIQEQARTLDAGKVLAMVRGH